MKKKLSELESLKIRTAKSPNPVLRRWSKQVIGQTEHIYWHLGLTPHWATIYKTHSKILAFAYTRPYIAANLPVRVIRVSGEYHVQIFDQKNPVVTHTFYPPEKHHHRKLRKKLEDAFGMKN